MKEVKACEMYAVRRVGMMMLMMMIMMIDGQKLGMWEERSSTFEDNMLVKGWFALYRPFYKKYFRQRFQRKEGFDGME